MRLFGSLMIGLSLFATTASAQINCQGAGVDCQTTKYGLGELPDFRLDKVPADQNLYDYTPADFGPNVGGASFYHSRGSFISGNSNCGGERGFAPYTGQILLREDANCTPTGTGPTCSGGANVGKACHLLPADGVVPGYVNPFRTAECPGTGVSCVDSGGGCRVEIPISDGGGVSPLGISSDALLPTLTVGVAAGSPFVLNAHASQTWGGSSHSVCINGPTPGALCRQHSDCGAGGSCRSTCSGGPTPGALCLADAECGAGGTCDISRGTCRLGPTPGAICLQDSDCGSGGTCPITTCSDTNFRYKPSSGTRYRLPTSHPEYDGSGNQTFVRWDYGQVDTTLAVRVANNTALRSHSDDSATCCNSTVAACNALIPPTNPVYPILNQRTCAVANRFSFEDNITNDWVFTGGRGTHFYTDPHFQVPGQIAGLCTGNPQLPCTSSAATALCTGVGVPYLCCTGAGTGPTCGSECGAGDTCSFKELGHRAQVVNGRDTFGDPRPRVCGANLYVMRGTPQVGCTLQPQYVVAGDPGSDCGLFNFGRDRRADANCDGVADFAGDGCPFLSEWDQDKDTDLDCAGGVGGDCRLDECECGDQNSDGRVNVQDIVDINIAIFAGVNRRLCDGNSDLGCTVSDIVAANTEIFNPDSSSCRHITSSRCGNNVVDLGEACDDGARCQGGTSNGALCDATAANNCPGATCQCPGTIAGTTAPCQRIGGDGCNTSCRIE